jgi:hypothetical protein
MNNRWKQEKNSLDRNPALHPPDELDCMLAEHFGPAGELAPSSGFALEVMNAVKSEISAPSPIAFPWRRALPGIVVLFCVMATIGVFLLRLSRAVVARGPSPHGSAAFRPAPLTFHLSSLEQVLCWIVLTACLSLALSIGAMRLASRSR